MSKPRKPQKSRNRYVFDAKKPAEIARLMQKYEFLKDALQHPFPERDPQALAGVKAVLDIGCGPAGWAIDVATLYPHMHIVGIDLSEPMLDEARSAAQKARLQNIEFICMDALQRRLNFPDATFDLVNIHSPVGFIPRESWEHPLREWYRITRPGGGLRITDVDRAGLTNSSAFEAYHYWCAQVLRRMGYGFSPDGYTFGITPMVGGLLQKAGYTSVHMKPYIFDLSSGTSFQTQYSHILQVAFQQMKQLILQEKLVDQAELEDCYTTLLDDIHQKTFCGLVYLLTIWGEK